MDADTVDIGPQLRCALPGADAVDVWHIDLDDAGWAMHGTVLNADEEQRAARFLRPVFGARHRHGRAALRLLLGAYSGRPAAALVLRYGPYGKPELDEGPYFNVSHCEGLALIAIAAEPVGIDIEMLQRPGLDISTLDRQISSSAELWSLRGLETPERGRELTRLWTRKEAYAKALGVGLHQDMRQLSVDDGSVSLTDGSRRLRVHDIRTAEGFVASLCHRADRPAIRHFRARPASLP